MKKNMITAASLLCSILMFAVSTGCNQQSNEAVGNRSDSLKATTDQQISSGEKWLKSIFQCQNENDYCFPDEEKVCTARYYEFFIESLEIFEYPDFETENERIAAEEAFKRKWEGIYPVDVPVLSPFGRGNGIESGQQLENVAITSHFDMKYTVTIDYGGGIKATSEVTLIGNDDSFLIDYMKSDFIE